MERTNMTQESKVQLVRELLKLGDTKMQILYQLVLRNGLLCKAMGRITILLPLKDPRVQMLSSVHQKFRIFDTNNMGDECVKIDEHSFEALYFLVAFIDLFEGNCTTPPRKYEEFEMKRMKDDKKIEERGRK